MRYDLSAIARRVRHPRRRSVTLRDIPPPATLATDLYRSAYSPMVDLWTRTGDSIAAEYVRTLAALTTDSPADLQTQLDAADGAFDRLFILLRAGLEGWAIQTERWQRGKWRGAVLSATGVDVDTLIGPADTRQTVNAAIEWNVSLIKDVHAQTRKKVADTVFAGVNQRRPAADVARDIRAATGFAQDRSKRIASDQMTKLTSALAEERQREAGIEKVEYKSSHKKHARPWHAARDGKVYDLDKRRPVDGGDPVPADDWAGKPPYCGCRTLARIEFD